MNTSQPSSFVRTIQHQEPFDSPSLDIIIVNWNTGGLLHECLKSIVSCDNTRFHLDRVIVVDNASSDGSARCLSDFSLPLELILNNANRGFAAACNQGARGTKCDYLLFLNPDTRLFVDTLDSAIGFMEVLENQRTGIVGVQLVDSGGSVSRTCSRFPTTGHFLAKIFGLERLFPRSSLSLFMMEWDHSDSREVDQVMGAFFLIRRRLFEHLGMFDERFFVYFEEVDLSLRARKEGWTTYFLASARAYHQGWGSSNQVKADRLYYSLSSRILYAFKHFSRASATILILAMFTVEPLARMILAAMQGSLSGVKEVALGYFRLLRQLPKLSQKVRFGRAE